MILWYSHLCKSGDHIDFVGSNIIKTVQLEKHKDAFSNVLFFFTNFLLIPPKPGGSALKTWAAPASIKK